MRSFLIGLVGVGGLAAPVGAAIINVPNNSFESPDIVFASGGAIDNWTKLEPVPPQVGLFDNTAVGQPDYIDNVSGGQVAFIFGGPGIGLFQMLSSTYTPGQSFSITAAIGGGGGGMPLGTTISVQLYYL